MKSGASLTAHPGFRYAQSGLLAEAAAQRPSKDEAEAGMAQMSKKFLDMGAEVYVAAAKAKEANKAL